MTISAIKPLLPATCVAIALAYASVNPAGKKPPIHVQILSFNDFHGQISAGLTIDGRAAGSAPVLWAYLRDEQKRFDGETFFVHAGDLIGGSIPQSALLQDEPAVMLLNTLVKRRFGRPLRADHPANNVICTPGNHEFDEGTDELLRIMKGQPRQRSVP